MITKDRKSDVVIFLRRIIFGHNRIKKCILAGVEGSPAGFHESDTIHNKKVIFFDDEKMIETSRRTTHESIWCK